MAISKVIYKTSAEDTGTVWMDTTDKTVAADKMVSGITALKNDGTTVTGNLTSRSSSDLTASGATVTVPAGVYSSQASKAVASGSATTPATTITANPSISVNSSTGVITATASATQSVTPTVSAGYVSSGTAGTITVSGSNTSQLSTQAAQTIHPSTTAQSIASGKFLTGTQSIAAVVLENLTAGNIKKDVVVKIGDADDDDCVASVTGTYEGGSTPSTSWEIVYDGDEYVESDTPYNYFTIANFTNAFGADETYRVTWGNSGQYVCQTFPFTTEQGDGYGIGNAGLDGGTDTGEPFLLARIWFTYLIATTNTPAGTIHVKIEKQVSGGGSTGLEYETGTYTPAQDILAPTISFANTHTEPPVIVVMSNDRSTASAPSVNAMMIWTYFDKYKAFGGGYQYSGSGSNAISYSYIEFLYNSTSGSAGGSRTTTTHNSSQTGSGVDYPSYYARNSGFTPYGNSTRYWLSGETYKWIAIWASST